MKPKIRVGLNDNIVITGGVTESFKSENMFNVTILLCWIDFLKAN